MVEFAKENIKQKNIVLVDAKILVFNVTYIVYLIIILKKVQSGHIDRRPF